MRIRRNALCAAVLTALSISAVQPVSLAWGQTVTTEEGPPVVTLHVLDRTATEQSPYVDSIPDTARVAVRRTGSVEESLTVYWLVQGDATPGVDYTTLPGAVEIPAKAEQVVFQIEAIDNDVPELRETVVMMLVPPVGLPENPPPYTLGQPAEGTVWIFDDDPAENQPPKVRIVTPPDNSVFGAPLQLLIGASASDLDGHVVAVEFFADGNSLGVAEGGVSGGVEPRDSSHPEWGSIAPFVLVWEQPTPGMHRLVAVAEDDNGAMTESLPVEIMILEVSSIPVVTVEATDPEGAEVGAGSNGDVGSDPAVFTLHRSGPVEQELTVRIRLAGTAENGVDYEAVPYEVVFSEGASKVGVRILPVDDALVEGLEKVLLAIVAPPAVEIWPPPAGLYWVGNPGQATAVILDNDAPANLPPVVTLLHPLDGEVFRAPMAIQLLAWAGDRDGEIASVEFFDGAESLGLGVGDTAHPNVYRLAWEGVPAGEYAIRAEATDDAGASQESRVAQIQVLEIQVPPVVTVVTLDGRAAEAPTDSAMPADPAKFRVFRTGSTEGELTVHYALTGSAQNGADYLELPSTVTFGVGEEVVDVDVVPLPDELVEGPETVVLALTPVRCLTAEDRQCWDGRCVGPYVVGEPGAARAVIFDDETSGNLPPRVAITQPADGEVFQGPQAISWLAAVRDPDGWVPMVEFYANDRKIGEAVVNFLQEPEPGQDQEFEWVWEGVMPGTYVLRAKATDSLGAQSWSGPVSILVTRTETRTVVSIVAADALATEPDADHEGDPGAFAVHRRGDLSIPLTVYYQVTGSADNGVDYERIREELTIPAGREKARIQVVPLADGRAEIVETVVVSLLEPPCIAIEPPPPKCYRVGDLGEAVVEILDRSEIPNRPPRIELVRPCPGEVFQAPARIRMVAMANDVDGRVVKVEFFADGERVGEQMADLTLLRTADADGRGFVFEWPTDGVGRHVLHVVATDDDGAASASSEVPIQVIESTLPPLVRILATDPHAAERPEGVALNPARFRVQRTGGTAHELVVFYSVGGTAAEGDDYAALERTVTLPAGRRSAWIVIDPVNDNEVEGVETVVIRLEPSPTASPVDPYRIGWPSKACAVIVDNDTELPIAQPLPGEGFHLCLPGKRGMPYRVEASEDLRAWVPVSDVLAEDGYVRFAEPTTEQTRHRFYRIRPVVIEAMPMEDD